MENSIKSLIDEAGISSFAFVSAQRFAIQILTLGIALVVLFVNVEISTAIAQEDNNQHNLLLKSTTRQAIIQLQQPCRLWTQQSLGTTLSEVSERFDIAIWIDRRLDPSQLIDLPQSLENNSLGGELSRLADSIGVGSGLVENVYLFAPKDRLARIQKAAVVLHGQLSSQGKRVAQSANPLHWSSITSYQELLGDLQKAWNIEVIGELPHDLLHAGKFPESSLATQLAILLGGFDLQATMPARRSIQPDRVTDQEREPTHSESIEQVEVTIKPISHSIHWKDSYARDVTPAVLEELRERHPTSQLQQLTDRWLLVNGETNLHYEIVSIGVVSGRRRNSTSDEPQQLYTFSIEASLPVEAVLQNLAKNFQLELEWSDKCKAADRTRLVQLKAENVSRQQLLELVCDQANLRLEHNEQRLIVHPKAPIP